MSIDARYCNDCGKNTTNDLGLGHNCGFITIGSGNLTDIKIDHKAQVNEAYIQLLLEENEKLRERVALLEQHIGFDKAEET